MACRLGCWSSNQPSLDTLRRIPQRLLGVNSTEVPLSSVNQMFAASVEEICGS